MPKFTIDHSTSLATPEAFVKIKEFLGHEEGIRRFDPKVQCQFNDSNHSCSIKGSQFNAELKILAENSGSKVSVTIDLPLMLTPFKGKVQETLSKQLKKYLG